MNLTITSMTLFTQTLKNISYNIFFFYSIQELGYGSRLLSSRCCAMLSVCMRFHSPLYTAAFVRCIYVKHARKNTFKVKSKLHEIVSFKNRDIILKCQINPQKFVKFIVNNVISKFSFSVRFLKSSKDIKFMLWQKMETQKKKNLTTRITRVFTILHFW